MDGLAKGKWTCEAKVLDGVPVQLNALTVGDVFQLSCRGESIAWNSEAKLQILAAGADPSKPDPYTLSLLGVEVLESDRAELQVTTYRPGEIQPAVTFTLTDGNHQATFSGLQLKTATVVEPSQDGKPPQAFGPVGPIVFWWGIEYWVLLASGILVGFSLILRRLWLWTERKKWKREVEKLKIARPAFDEFHKELRTQLRDRAVAMAKDPAKVAASSEYSLVRQSFFNYVTRQFSLPVHMIGRRRFMKEVRASKKDAVEAWSEAIEELDKLIREIEVQSKKSPGAQVAAGLTLQDVDQMIQQMRRFSESVERIQRKEERA